MCKSLRILGAIVVGGMILNGVSASAATFVASTTYGGNTYELWDSPGISWSDAGLAAASLGGYLATLADETETLNVYRGLIGNGFFTANDGQRYSAWLGGYTTAPNQSTTDPTAWAWVTGEAWTAFAVGNFYANEPNGDSSGLTINRFGDFQWNDESGPVGGYIVEIGKVGVPDGGTTVALLGCALSLLGFLSRRPRK